MFFIIYYLNLYTYLNGKAVQIFVKNLIYNFILPALDARIFITVISLYRKK
jgi:hypothetical protein